MKIFLALMIISNICFSQSSNNYLTDPIRLSKNADTTTKVLFVFYEDGSMVIDDSLAAIQFLLRKEKQASKNYEWATVEYLKTKNEYNNILRKYKALKKEISDLNNSKIKR